MYLEHNGHRTKNHKQTNKQKSILKFLKAVGNECRVLVFVDTHSNSATGSLQVHVPTKGRLPGTVPVDVVSPAIPRCTPIVLLTTHSLSCFTNILGPIS